MVAVPINDDFYDVIKRLADSSNTKISNLIDQLLLMALTSVLVHELCKHGTGWAFNLVVRELDKALKEKSNEVA